MNFLFQFSLSFSSPFSSQFCLTGILDIVIKVLVARSALHLSSCFIYSIADPDLHGDPPYKLLLFSRSGLGLAYKVIVQ